jgi:acetyl-CoA synthetase
LHRHVGRGRAPIINVSGGTEIGTGILVCDPLTPIIEGRFTGANPGMAVEALGDDGMPAIEEPGELVLTRSWPSMTRGFWDEPDRYLETYWSRWPGVWVQGDRAIRHADGSWELPGRSDDLLKVAGKRIGPVEYESLATEVAGVVSAAAVGIAHPTKGELPVVVVVPMEQDVDCAHLRRQVTERITDALGKPMRPTAIVVVNVLPMTRSGKVHRRAVRAWLSGTDPGDLSTVENLEAAHSIIAARRQLASDDNPESA